MYLIVNVHVHYELFSLDMLRRILSFQMLYMHFVWAYGYCVQHGSCGCYVARRSCPTSSGQRCMYLDADLLHYGYVYMIKSGGPEQARQNGGQLFRAGWLSSVPCMHKHVLCIVRTCIWAL